MSGTNATITVSHNYWAKTLTVWYTGPCETSGTVTFTIGYASRQAATQAPTGTVSANSDPNETDPKKKIYLANEQGLNIEYRLTTDTVAKASEYDTVKASWATPEKGGWQPIGEYMLDHGFNGESFGSFYKMINGTKDYTVWHGMMDVIISAGLAIKYDYGEYTMQFWVGQNYPGGTYIYWKDDRDVTENGLYGWQSGNRDDRWGQLDDDDLVESVYYPIMMVREL